VVENVLSIDEAASLTGLSRRALEGRIARGTLPAEKRGGRVFIDISDLHRLRLVGSSPQEAYVLSELLDRLERQAEEIGRLKAELERKSGR
jgi:excisionase family DNA binding protein